MTLATSELHKWYRQPYVWMLIAIPALAVVTGAVMLFLAIRSNDGLVVDDYYQRGKEINRVLKRDEVAASIGLQGKLRFAFKEGRVKLDLSHHSKTVLPALVTLRFMHVTRSGMDNKTILLRTPDGQYHGFLPKLYAGRWYLQLETEQWRLLGNWIYPEDAEVNLRPGLEIKMVNGSS